MLSLNLGCNDRHLDGYLNVDIAHPCDLLVDLNIPRWPWDNNSVFRITADDIVEHLLSRTAFMNEAWRILNPEGVMRIVTPNAAKGGGFFQDPTHITPWTINSFKYFDHRCFEYQRLRVAYGIKGGWEVVDLKETNYQDQPIAPGLAMPDPVFKIEAIMRPMK